MLFRSIQAIGESLLPHARSVSEQVSAEWVMEVRCEDMARSMRGEDASEPADSPEPSLGRDVASTSIEPNVVPPGSEQPAPSLVAPSADAAGPVS